MLLNFFRNQIMPNVPYICTAGAVCLLCKKEQRLFWFRCVRVKPMHDIIIIYKCMQPLSEAYINIA